MILKFLLPRTNDNDDIIADLEKNTENGQNISKTATERLSGNSEETGLSEVVEVRYRRTEKDEVARAHQVEKLTNLFMNLMIL